MTRNCKSNNHSLSCAVKVPLLALMVLFLFGCLPGNKPPQMIVQYTFEYPPPIPDKESTSKDSIRVNRFAIAQTFNSTSMIYRPVAYRMASYNASRWRVNPADMVTDFLLRDLRKSHIFGAVFSYRETEETRFILEGGVEEFLEADEGSSGAAVLVLRIALIDSKGTDTARRLVFQKQYSVSEPLKEQSPDAFARGMSIAMSRLSSQIVKDLSGSMIDAVK